MNKRRDASFRLWQPATHADLAIGVPPAGGRAVAIGNFDGAHRGHAALVKRAHAVLGADGEVLALTFEPHPARFFRPQIPHFRLLPQALRAQALADIGFDGALVLPFEAELAAMSAEEFLTKIIVDRLRATLVVVGEDFHFGKGREGTPEFLREAGLRLGFRVLLVPPVTDESGTIISSTRIRKALGEGKVEQANRLLGRAFAIAGTVIHGAKRGRELGYPTANIALDPGIAIKQGVYAVEVVLEGKTWLGAANFGTRPQFDNGAPLLEVHLLDFSGDLYDKVLEVRFIAYLREEAKFSSLDSLLAQMAQDCKKARDILSSGGSA